MTHLRRWLRVLHRDIGYLAVGLTIIFSVSGIAVNHIHDWNPNWSIEKETFEFTPFTATGKTDAFAKIIRVLELEPERVERYFRPSPDEIHLFLEEGTIEANYTLGKGYREIAKKRFLLFEFNRLHLNELNKTWRWISDLFALALIFLALSGLFIVKGKKGFVWRGLLLTAIGLLLPLAFMYFIV
jgi:hypothetical protein